MDVKLIAKKVFWPIFIVVFLVIAFFVGKFIFTTTLSDVTVTNPDVEVKEFTCKSTSKDVAYVYLHGFGDHNPGAFDYQKSLIGEKPILDFDYDEKLTLAEISTDFVSQFNSFAAAEVDEIIIIGQSAGGVIAAHSASQLQFSGSIELHTLASPLNGFHVPEAFLGKQVGFGKEMAAGFSSFSEPASNVKSYHHKTIHDEELQEYCGAAKNFCDGLKIQRNNIPGSEEFFYNHTHTSIMHPVSKLIIDCHS